MARGITQAQVNGAADAILNVGENPTVEKVRAELGTGSPNTITRMLDAWRSQLGERLRQLSALPEVPGSVGQAMVELWRLAVTHAESSARTSLAHDQNELIAAQASLTQERKIWDIALAQAEANVADALTKQSHAELQLAERQVLLAQTEAQRLDLLQQRDRLQEQGERLAKELDQMRTQLAATEAKASIERGNTADHIRSVEDRANHEIDRARQEIKEVRLRLLASQRDAEKATQKYVEEMGRLGAALHASERVAANHAGRAEALEAQLSQREKPPRAAKKRSANPKKKQPPKAKKPRSAGNE